MHSSLKNIRSRTIDDLRARLYLISPPSFELDDFEIAFRRALDGGDVACFQLRMKDQPADVIRQAADKLIPIAQDKGVAFLLNDDPSLAKSIGADGVHIGQDDTPNKEARAILGEDAIIGVTCHSSRHLAMMAAEQGADYVAFGAFYPTETKTVKSMATPDILQWWNAIVETPCVAIGGITVDNAAPLIKSGADFLAVSGGIWNYTHGPEKAVTEFNRIIDMTVAT